MPLAFKVLTGEEGAAPNSCRPLKAESDEVTVTETCVENTSSAAEVKSLLR